MYFYGPDVGPMRPDGQPRHMRRARAPDVGETNWVFRQVERYLDRLTTFVLMAERGSPSGISAAGDWSS